MSHKHACLENICDISDEKPLLDEEDVDEGGYGMYAWRRAEYDDSKETYDKQLAVLYYPDISTGMEW